MLLVRVNFIDNSKLRTRTENIKQLPHPLLGSIVLTCLTLKQGHRKQGFQVPTPPQQTSLNYPIHQQRKINNPSISLKNPDLLQFNSQELINTSTQTVLPPPLLYYSKLLFITSWIPPAITTNRTSKPLRMSQQPRQNESHQLIKTHHPAPCRLKAINNYMFCN